MKRHSTNKQQQKSNTKTPQKYKQINKQTKIYLKNLQLPTLPSPTAKQQQ